jgi:hypothetical protein
VRTNAIIWSAWPYDAAVASKARAIIVRHGTIETYRQTFNLFAAMPISSILLLLSLAGAPRRTNTAV